MYNCSVCNHATSTVTDLHNHHIHYHTSEELSHTIINLQGLETCFKPAALNNSNNNNSWYEHVMVKTEKKDSYGCEDGQMTNSTIFYDENSKFYHDETYCSLNCSPFIIWEHELNKRTEICDEDFFNIVENLCTDLSKRKQKGKKRKNLTYTNNIREESFVQHNENRNLMGTGDENIKTFNHFPSEISNPVTSSWNTNYSIPNTTAADEILNLQVVNDVNIRHDDINRFTFVGTDAENNVLMYDSLNNAYSWNPVTTINFDGKQEHAVYNTN